MKNNIEYLVKEFLKNSRSFDREISKIDSKHSKIVSDANKKIDDLNNFNFRNWENQSDIGLKYPMTFITKIFLGIKKNIFFNFLIDLINRRIGHVLEYSSMLDDIEILKSLGAKRLLTENPQDKTPGSSKYPLVEGYSVSSRWLRYLYLLNQIKRFNLLKNDDFWLDIGSYYGGLQGLVKKYHPDIRIVMIDFNHQLLRSYIYLKSMYPNVNHIFPNDISSISDQSKIPKGSILYVEIEDFKKLDKFKINLTTNFFSLGEMKKEVFDSYMNSKIFKNSDKIYFVNRFFSSPFFEKTYDYPINIFDYKLDKKTLYFDIFPISQFLINSRKILNRKFFRNFSSEYFEIIFSKNK